MGSGTPYTCGVKRFDLVPEPDLHPDFAMMVAAWRDGTREWRDELGTPPVEAIVWQPYENGPSIGGLLLHMTACDQGWIIRDVLGQEIVEMDAAIAYMQGTDVDAHRWPAPPREPLSWYLELLDRNREAMIGHLRTADPEATVDWGDDYRFSARWIVAHLVEHDSYHGGQLVLLHEMWKRTQNAGN